MNERSKYYALYAYLQAAVDPVVELSLQAIEAITGRKLPASARTNPAWWSNRRHGALQAQAWMEAGYRVSAFDPVAGRVTFRRPESTYQVRAGGGIKRWDANLVKALREHMAMSQAELAAELGVRQQTISEWETGVYQPRRAMSKLLTMVAEQMGFTYGSD